MMTGMMMMVNCMKASKIERSVKYSVVYVLPESSGAWEAEKRNCEEGEVREMVQPAAAIEICSLN
jgi:hypothetical protein